MFSLYKEKIVEIWYNTEIEGKVYFEGEKCKDKEIIDRYLHTKVPTAYGPVRYYNKYEVV